MHQNNRERKTTLAPFHSHDPFLWQTQRNRHNALAGTNNNNRQQVEQARHQALRSKEEANFFFGVCVFFEAAFLLSIPVTKNYISDEKLEQNILIGFTLTYVIFMALLAVPAISMRRVAKHDSDTEKACDEWLRNDTAPRPF